MLTNTNLYQKMECDNIKEIGPYLIFNGNCEEAIKKYQEIFNCKNLQMFKYSDLPPNQDFPLPKGSENMVLHGEMVIDRTMFLFSDTPNDYVHGNNTAIFVKTDSVEEVKRLHESLKDGATIHIDIGPTFFSHMYSFLTDKYGVSWQFIYVED